MIWDVTRVSCLLIETFRFTRVGNLKPFALPGGDGVPPSNRREPHLIF